MVTLEQSVTTFYLERRGLHNKETVDKREGWRNILDYRAALGAGQTRNICPISHKA